MLHYLTIHQENCTLKKATATTNTLWHVKFHAKKQRSTATPSFVNLGFSISWINRKMKFENIS